MRPIDTCGGCEAQLTCCGWACISSEVFLTLAVVIEVVDQAGGTARGDLRIPPLHALRPGRTGRMRPPSVVHRVHDVSEEPLEGAELTGGKCVPDQICDRLLPPPLRNRRYLFQSRARTRQVV